MANFGCFQNVFEANSAPYTERNQIETDANNSISRGEISKNAKLITILAKSEVPGAHFIIDESEMIIEQLRKRIKTTKL